MDTIKKYSPERKTEFQIDLNSRNNLTRVKPAFFDTYLAGYTTSHPDSWEMTSASYLNHYFFDFQEHKTWASFSILADSESGFMQLYQYTYLKKTGTITSVSRVGVYEGDGGAGRDDILKYSKNGQKLKVLTKYTFSEYLFDEDSSIDCHSLISDSVVSRFEFYPNKTNYHVDTIFSKLDTICY